MLVTCKTIVLKAVKYAEADLIVSCYTELGIRSYFIKKIFKQKKGPLSPAFFMPLSQLEITANYQTNKTLHFIKEAKISHPYSSIFSNVAKQAIVIFLSEVLSASLQEEEENESLFSFLETSLNWLDTHNEIANFHLLFLINLTKYLGFYPEKNQHLAYFNLEEGKFSAFNSAKHSISGNELVYFKALLGTNFDVLNGLEFNKESRQTLLDILIVYFQLHLPGFKKPKSLEVLKTVFN